jgi:hypothetical protein
MFLTERIFRPAALSAGALSLCLRGRHPSLRNSLPVDIAPDLSTDCGQ